MTLLLSLGPHEALLDEAGQKVHFADSRLHFWYRCSRSLGLLSLSHVKVMVPCSPTPKPSCTEGPHHTPPISPIWAQESNGLAFRLGVIHQKSALSEL